MPDTKSKTLDYMSPAKSNWVERIADKLDIEPGMFLFIAFAVIPLLITYIVWAITLNND